MSNKTVDAFIRDLVESPQGLPIFPTTWDKKLEQYCGEEDQAQDQEKSEEE